MRARALYAPTLLQSALVFGAARGAPAAGGVKPAKLAVMPLQPLRGVDKDVTKILTAMIATQAGTVGLFSQVISAAKQWLVAACSQGVKEACP